MTNCSEWKMLEFIHRENIARIQAQLEAATTESRRAVLRKIIADEAAAYELAQEGRTENAQPDRA